MKNIICLIACLNFASVLLAQEAETVESSDTRYVYCDLIGASRLLSTKVTISIDYGENESVWNDTRVRDESTGKVVKFNSMIDALNMMSAEGWEFVTQYTVVVQQGQYYYHWILKKKVSTE